MKKNLCQLLFKEESPNQSLAKEIWSGPIPEEEKKRLRKPLLPKGFQP